MLRFVHILDLIITNMSHFYSTPTVTAPLGRSDHHVINWSRNTDSAACLIKKGITKRKVRRFTQSSCAEFGRWCSGHVWFCDVQYLDSATALASSFTSELSSAIDLFFFTKTIKIHATDKPWMTPMLKQLIIQRQRAFHSGNRAVWLHHRDKVQREISSQRMYYARKIQNLKNSNPRQWWNYIKQITGKEKSTPNFDITSDGVSMSDLELCGKLNEHFLSASADLPPLDLGNLPAYLPALEPPPSISIAQVCSKLLKIKAFKSNSPDCIPNRVLSQYAQELADPVANIFNKSLLHSEFPIPWKDANIVPIPKAQPITCEDETRPIALTATLSKILEDFVVTWMIDDVKDKIDPKQFGSLRGSSTTFSLIDMINNWLQALDSPKRYLRICFLDFSKAFDRINHNILIANLIALGGRRCLIPWICDFLSNRRQAVKIKESCSEWVYVNGGVPQGTKLGPVLVMLWLCLILVMINDLKMKSLNSSHRKYVDDVTISEVIKATEESCLQTELNELQQWACENDMKLNGLKCKEMVVSFLQHSDNNTPLYINDQQLELVTSFKSLGVSINNQLKWNDNVAIIVKKASKRLYILRVLRRSGIPSADLLSIYNALIRSVFEYACEVWHTSLPQYLSNKIERVQKRALRILFPFTDYAEALSISRCSRLDDRRHSICQNTFQKIAKPCLKLHHLLPSTRGNVHGRILRKIINYHFPNVELRGLRTVLSQQCATVKLMYRPFMVLTCILGFNIHIY